MSKFIHFLRKTFVEKILPLGNYTLLQLCSGGSCASREVLVEVLRKDWRRCESIREATLLLTPILEAEQSSIPETVKGGACSKVFMYPEGPVWRNRSEPKKTATRGQTQSCKTRGCQLWVCLGWQFVKAQIHFLRAVWGLRRPYFFFWLKAPWRWRRQQRRGGAKKKNT